MTPLAPLPPTEVRARVDRGDAVLVDIREPDEFARSHIPGARSVPLSRLDSTPLALDGAKEVVFLCRSGGRTNANCDRLARQVGGPAYLLDGGLDAWRAAGLPVDQDRGAPLEIMRQVQIAAGSLVLLGVLLAWLVAPGFIAISAFVGSGLLFAGVSGWCGMANLLALMPWNRRAAA